jgi:hypothetical protein
MSKSLLINLEFIHIDKRRFCVIEAAYGAKREKFDFFIAIGVGLSPLYCGHFWPIVPAPDDR